MPDDKRLHVRGDEPTGAAPYPLSGDTLVRALRSLTALQGVGFDQANRQSNQFGLDARVGFQAQILNADAAPFRSNGRSFRSSAATPSNAGVNSFVFVYNDPANTNVVGLIDEFKMLLSAATVSTAYLVPASATAAILAQVAAQGPSVVDTESRNFTVPNGIRVLHGFGGAAVLTPVGASQIDAFPTVAAAAPPVIATYGDIAIYPGCGFLVVATTVVQPFTYAIKGRVWLLGQGNPLQLFG